MLSPLWLSTVYLYRGNIPETKLRKLNKPRLASPGTQVRLPSLMQNKQIDTQDAYPIFWWISFSYPAFRTLGDDTAGYKIGKPRPWMYHIVLIFSE